MVRQMVDRFADELSEFKTVDLATVAGEDAFLEAFNQCAAKVGVKFCSEESADYFQDDVREALGYKRALTNVFWLTAPR